MSLNVATAGSTGQTLFASAQQIASGVLGDTWNVTTSAWASSVADADAKITMTEGSGRNLQSYFGSVTTTLGTYTGQVLVRIHDDAASDVVLGSDIIYMVAGVEATLGTVSATTISAVIVKRERTWLLRDHGEFSTAPETVTLSVGTTATLAMDFGQVVNPGSDLTGTPTVSVDTVESGTAPALSNVALSQHRQQVHVDCVAAVVGRYKLKFTASTTDSQTFTGYGWLNVS